MTRDAKILLALVLAAGLIAFFMWLRTPVPAEAQPMPATGPMPATESADPTNRPGGTEVEKLRDGCALIYSETIHKRRSDLTIEEERAIHTCEVMGLYSRKESL